MRKFRLIHVSVLIICLILGWSSSSAGSDQIWERLSDGITDANLRSIAVDPGNPSILFVGSQKNIYRTRDQGKHWEVVFTLPGTFKAVNFFAFDPADSKKIYAATQNGLFKTVDGGDGWRVAFRGVGAFERDALCVAISPKDSRHLYVGTLQGFFVSKDEGSTWQRASGKMGKLLIRHVAIDPVSPNVLYAATNQGVFRSEDRGDSWDRIYVTSEEELELDEVEADELFETDELLNTFSKVRNIAIDPLDPQRLYIACFNGVMTSADSGRTWSKLTEVGLTVSDMRQVAVTPHNSSRPIYAATRRGVFRFTPEEARWEEIYRGLTNRDFRFLVFDPGDIRSLWGAAKDAVYKTREDKTVSYAQAPSGAGSTEVDSVLAAFRHEPTIQEVQSVAINYAEVHPSKISSWRSQARIKHLIPSVTVDLDRYLYKTLDLRGSTTQPFYVIGPDDEQRNLGYSFKWDIGGLIWSTDQTSIDTRSRLMVQLRDDILDELTKTYFERRRLQVEMLLSPPRDLSARVQKELRLQELTARIDSLTGGWFLRKIEENLKAGRR